MVLTIALVQQKKSINFTKVKKTFCLSLLYNSEESYFYLIKREICKFKVHDETGWYDFCLRNQLKKFVKRLRELNF